VHYFSVIFIHNCRIVLMQQKGWLERMRKHQSHLGQDFLG